MRKTKWVRGARVGPVLWLWTGTALLAMAATAAGCGGDDNVGGPTGGSDSGSDGTSPGTDGGPHADAGNDSTAPTDSGQDTGPVTDTGPGNDTGPADTGGGDTGTDTGSDTGSDTGTDTGTDSGPLCDDNGGNVATVTMVAAGSATGFSMPLDAVPDTAGAMVYFTALAADGTGGVYSVAATGAATPTKLASGLGIVTSIALSSDGQTLLLADPAAPSSTADRGAILTMGTSAGKPAILSGTDGYQPRGVTVQGTTVFFTGIDPANGMPGVFSINIAGGSASAVAEGAPFVDPNGVAAASNGDVYVSDSTASNAWGAIIAVPKGGSAAAVAGGLTLGLPAGLAYSADEKTLVSSASAAGKGELLLFNTSNPGTPATDTTGAIGTATEGAGLHRAIGGCTYAYVDSAAGGFGAVYTLTK
jgi:hypothetical protein